MRIIPDAVESEEHMSAITVRSLKAFIGTIGSIKAQSDINTDSNFFFRGQCNNSMPIPSVFRDSYMENEDVLYHELILRCPESFRKLSHLDILVMMQHYGLPTRLLDVTTNPLIALFFACKDYSGNHGDMPGYIYVYKVPDEKVAYSDSDRILMLSCLPVFSSKDKEKMIGIISKTINNTISKNRDNTYPAAIERLFHEIRKEIPAFKREIKPIDLMTPIVVKPMRANARILKQDGAFIISGLCNDKDDAEQKINRLCNNVIEIQDRREVLRELDDFGINEASLFPEVDKVADYLKEKYGYHAKNQREV